MTTGEFLRHSGCNEETVVLELGRHELPAPEERGTSVNHRSIFVSLALALALGLVWLTPADARDSNISGGIQYVIQGDKYKAQAKDDPAYMKDAFRVYEKAVDRLTKGIAKDPGDVEAYDYLGRAYAELNRPAEAGQAFATGIEKATEKGDKEKLVKRMNDNRQHYWATYYTEAMESFNASQAIEDEAVQKDSILAASERMRHAIEMWPDQTTPRTATWRCSTSVPRTASRRWPSSKRVSRSHPRTRASPIASRNLVVNMGIAASNSGDYATAIAVFEGVLAENPEDYTTAQQLGELYFKQGQSVEGEAEKQAAFEGAAKNFGIHYSGNLEDPNSAYNYALSLSLSGQYDKAAELVHDWLVKRPDDPDIHGLMANAYTGMGLKNEAVGHQLIARALREGEKDEDPAALAKATADEAGAKSEAAKYLAEWGAPDEIRTLTTGEVQTQTWFWWETKQVATLHKGRKVSEVNFAEVAMADGAAETASTP